MNIANHFWQAASEDHGIDKSGKKVSERGPQYTNVLFKETQMEQYHPRGIFVDTDPFAVDELRSGSWGSFYGLDNYIAGSKSCDNIFAAGMNNSEFNDITEEFKDVIRREMEYCDKL